MSVRLSRGEYWLLLQSVTMQLPLPLLMLPEGPPWDRATIDQTLNCDGHGMSPDELAQVLCDFATRGWIKITRFADDSQPLGCDLAMINAELRRRGPHEKNAYYGLTGEGGAAWERFARPHWHRYIEHETDYDVTIEGDEYADTARRLEASYVVAESRKELDRYLFAVRCENDIEPDSEQFDIVPAWQPIYWKPPREGHRCRLRYREKKHLHGIAHMTSFYRRAWCKWH